MAEVDYLELLKGYLHVTTDADDDNLQHLMKTAHTTLKGWCGEFELDNEVGCQLVFDYVRYMRAGASEYFRKNFQAQIVSFGFDLMEVPDEDT